MVERKCPMTGRTSKSVAGGHAFGKCHGAALPTYVGLEPEAAWKAQPVK